MTLPIEALRASFLANVRERPVVVSSPTGSGKSTEVPRWCRGRDAGRDERVLVVEPRRVACRSLAARVAELEGSRVGESVGYVVRDDAAMNDATRIVFATPGIVLRHDALVRSADTIVLDELHERTLDVDLLLALFVRRERRGLVVMSATLDGDRVAAHIGGVHLSAEGRAFPVDIRYLERGDALPDAGDLPARVRAAVRGASSDPGDVLVFLPGKAEIEACRRALEGEAAVIVPLHGGLSLDEQRRAFDSAKGRKVILATNVAETSITIPGVGVVIDAGLVRQTRYQDGRGALVLAPIADDSAAQRAGRAGRTAAGICYRLWSSAVRLSKTTLPEIHRESLVPLVMSAAAWGERPEDLPFLDPPKPYALQAARADLAAWGVLDPSGALTEGGRGIFALPLDPFLGRLLVAARAQGAGLEDTIDLVSALGVGRPLFLPGPAPQDPHDDLRLAGCDATALVRAVRIGRPDVHHVSGFAIEEARRVRARLRRLHALPEGGLTNAPVDREALIRIAMMADPRVVHVARKRGRAVAFANGGTELELARESAVQNARDVDAIVVLDARAFGSGPSARLLVTCATPVSLAVMARAGLGEDRLASVHQERGRVTATIERIYAERVIATREDVPSGEMARAAIAALFVRGSIFKEALATTRERLSRIALAAQLATRGHPAGVPHEGPVPTLEGWVAARLVALGVESGSDLAMLSAVDLTIADVPFEVRAGLDREFPRGVDVGDARYEAIYDLDRNQVVLKRVKGNREGAPPLAYLPRFPGLRILVDGPRGTQVVRERG
ncbi:MAG TPA: helicase-related protein [Labilithrix sp.]|nr:helicase-related protein [Labilithrix sp.]